MHFNLWRFCSSTLHQQLKSSHTGPWDHMGVHGLMCVYLGPHDMKAFEKPWSGTTTNSLKHHNINPTAARSELLCPQELPLPWAKWLVQTEYSLLIKARLHPTGQRCPKKAARKYSVTCWPIHWLANTFPFQKYSSAHLRVPAYERECTVEDPLWSQHIGELLLVLEIKMVDDRVNSIFFLDLTVKRGWWMWHAVYSVM